MTETINDNLDRPVVQVSVRGLVEFILRNGDLDNRRSHAPETAMQEGSRIHRQIQNSMDSSYRAEFPLMASFDAGEYDIVVDGRADGVIDRQNLIHEIKGTYRKLKKIKKPQLVHMAQAKCYAYMYATEYKRDEMTVRLTYCNLKTERTKEFEEAYSVEELTLWWDALLTEYKKWMDFVLDWKKQRTESIKNMDFPYPYREGQKQLVTYVYQTIYHKRKLFLEAPTGVGKTISTVFPALKSMGEERTDKLFYLTAKTIARTVAVNTFELLRKEQGLKLKSTLLTAKEKICMSGEVECNPVACPLAKGHFDRINEALYEMLTNEDNIDRDTIENYAARFQVCPFELSLDATNFSDAIIGDYNYVFDPHAKLKRYFSEGLKGKYVFLVDEAHNLVERGREMYSAELHKEEFVAMRDLMQDIHSGVAECIEACNQELLKLKRNCEGFRVEKNVNELSDAVNALIDMLNWYMEESEGTPVHKELQEFFFNLNSYQCIAAELDDNYVIYTQLDEEGRFLVKLFCINPSDQLRACMQKGLSSILFSATLLPIDYYKSLLGANPEDYEVYAKSVFEPEKLMVMIGTDVTSQYKKRGSSQYMRYASYINKTVTNKPGNYMVFFPSHSFLKSVYEVYEDVFSDEEKEILFIQEEHMDELGREQFLSAFDLNGEKSVIGFCVLGGIFGEGIDLTGERLIGSIIVGTGLPLVCEERELLKEYFENRGYNGFDYAYRFPGMNKVLQSAGRVIRTTEDIGIVELLDERFLLGDYNRLFPREWQQLQTVKLDSVDKKIVDFWKKQSV